ncbi:hypothetical protein [Bradyrhizobium sp. CB2312]|uniref:hypothetical protein n=1 Tax=Bradyrhizobium sp. CB2312 TaxID=3039155 RepID=UPI0024B19012|nr:hypothetical protein [Bradyrhizobium sp. CB2312]WFU75232.1 hypothetical protein QA642_15005 [Bradyrhizobium sp. CB2312]
MKLLVEYLERAVQLERLAATVASAYAKSAAPALYRDHGRPDRSRLASGTQ